MLQGSACAQRTFDGEANGTAVHSPELTPNPLCTLFVMLTINTVEKCKHSLRYQYSTQCTILYTVHYASIHPSTLKTEFPYCGSSLESYGSIAALTLAGRSHGRSLIMVPGTRLRRLCLQRPKKKMVPGFPPDDVTEVPCCRRPRSWRYIAAAVVNVADACSAAGRSQCSLTVHGSFSSQELECRDSRRDAFGFR